MILSQLSLSDALTIAWRKVKGTKATFLAALMVVGVINFTAGLVKGFVGFFSGELGFILQYVASLVAYIANVGLLYIGIQHARNLPINYRLLFKSFRWPTAARLAAIYIIGTLVLFIAATLTAKTHSIAYIGMAIISTLFCLWFNFRMFLAPAFIIDANLPVIPAIKASFQATDYHVIKLAVLILIQMGIIIISALPLAIGLIWTLPMMFILYGVVYVTLAPQSKQSS